MHNVAIVATGTIGAQIITMSFAPIITRLYGPEAFGVLGAYTALLGIVAKFSTLNYPIAIVLPEADCEAVGLGKLSLKISIIVSVFVAIGVAVGNRQIQSAFNLSEINFLWLLLALGVFFAGLLAVQTQWALRRKLFKLKAKVVALQALIVNSAKTIAGLAAPAAIGLVIIATFAGLVHAAMLYFGKRKTEANTASGVHQKPDDAVPTCLNLAAKYKDFALYRTPQVAINGMSQGVPVLILAFLFGPLAAGFYSLCKMVLTLPTKFIGEAVSSVFYPHINEAIIKGKDPYWIILKATLGLAALGCLPFSILVVFGPVIFKFVFGAEWELAGQYAQWMALWSFFAFINRPSVGAIPVLSIQGIYLLMETGTFFLRVAALLVGGVLLDNALMAIMLFSFVGVSFNITIIAVSLFFSGKLRNGNNRKLVRQ